MNYAKKGAKPQFTIYPKRKSSVEEFSTLYVRTTYQFVEIDKSLGIKILFTQWDSHRHKILDNPYHQRHVDEVFGEFKEKVMGAYYLLSQNGAESTLREIMDLAFAENEKQSYSLFGVFGNLLLRMEKQKTQKRQQSNLLKHHTCMKHLKAFVKQHFNQRDIAFNKINRNFIEEFELYLKTTGKNGHNSTMKMLQIFKKVYRIAVDNRWTSNNAFNGKRLSYTDVDIEVLTQSEIKLLKEFDLKKNYLSKTRDLFLFCIYTGVAYTDLQHLQRRHLESNTVSGQYMLRKKREKTGIEFLLPLFHPAQQLLDKWVPQWENAVPDLYLAPKISNQKFNDYLKELTATVGIQKSLGTHSGRHTFATTVALENGVAIESVSKMLGHSKISQTQKYAKVTALKIERETKGLADLLRV